jgi:hypothetical protein
MKAELENIKGIIKDETDSKKIVPLVITKYSPDQVKWILKYLQARRIIG